MKPEEKEKEFVPTEAHYVLQDIIFEWVMDLNRPVDFTKKMPAVQATGEKK